MSFPTIPSATETITDLHTTLDLVYAALQDGITKASTHFRKSGIGLDQEKQAFSSIVRLHAKQFLKRRHLESAELEHANLCGIWLHVGAYHLKVWRISEDDLEKAQAPVSHLFEQFQFLQDNEPVPLIHLRVYWKMTKSGRLSLYLAYPKYEDPRSTECFWLHLVREPESVKKLRNENKLSHQQLDFPTDLSSRM